MSRSHSSSQRHSIIVPVSLESLRAMDHRHLFALEHLAESFSTALLPDSEVAASALSRLAERLELTPELRTAASVGSQVKPQWRDRFLEERARGVVVCLHPRDAATAAEIARNAWLPIIGALVDADDENQSYLRAGGHLEALIALSYEELVAGAALGSSAALHLILSGAARENLLLLGGEEDTESEPYWTGVCTTPSLAPHLRAISAQVEEFAHSARARYGVELLAPPESKSFPFSGDLTPAEPDFEELLDSNPDLGRPPKGWRNLFAAITGGSTDSDEETILMCHARGVPVLALDGPVARELIRHGRTGYIFSTDKFDDVRLHLALMARFSDERRRIAHGAQVWNAQAASPAAAKALLTSLVRAVMVSTGEHEVVASPRGYRGPAHATHGLE